MMFFVQYRIIVTSPKQFIMKARIIQYHNNDYKLSFIYIYSVQAIQK